MEISQSAKGTEFFEYMIGCHNGNYDMVDKYAKMRRLLALVTKDLTSGENITFPNLFSKLHYVCLKTGLSKNETYGLDTFRVNANNVLCFNYMPSDEVYLSDLQALAFAVSHFYSLPLPDKLNEIFPQKENKKRFESVPVQFKRRDRIRVNVVDWDESFIYCFEEEEHTEEPIRVRHSMDGDNGGFPVSILWKYCRLNLIDVTVGSDGIYMPQLIIVEPDYLLDISSLAECVKEYGRHPLNYIRTRFENVRSNKYFMLGNAANLFLDELVNEKQDSPVNFKDCLKKLFKTYPFELSTCAEIDSTFFLDAELQFNNIKRVVEKIFPVERIDRNCAMIEPSFMCEQLGIRGRLDFLQLKDADNVVIELKSGKAPFPENDYTKICGSHQAQAFLYQIVIQKALGIDFNSLRTFILYSKYSNIKANLRISRPYMSAIREVLNIRNSIVAMERAIAGNNGHIASENLIADIKPDTLITEQGLNYNFLGNYVIPQIEEFKKTFKDADTLELSYFHSFHSFVVRENFYSKTGGVDDDFHRSFSSLWLSSFKDKKDEGEILFDLNIEEDRAAEETPVIKLRLPFGNREMNFLHNFRNGDIVVLYERNKEADNVTNRQVIRGTVEHLSSDGISIRLRSRQRNPAAFPPDSRYAVEHDYMESSQNSIYKGLYMFLQANRDRRDLLLNRRKPRYDASRKLNGGIYINEYITDIVLKARQAEDYFILVGPPGTGKTSQALKSMVEEFYSDNSANILLLSYTNRAVDEICDALDSIDEELPYVRIGQELSCKERHRKRLLDKMIETCNKREQVRNLIDKHRIFVATTASFAGKMDIFNLKHFDVAIIDEASQILEPQIIGILSAKDSKGNNGIDKFILTGDHKQLPAVVMQPVEDSRVEQPELCEIGLTDRRNSLFERLYRTNEAAGNDYATGFLHRQGRMHPEVSLFPNIAFYGNKLLPIPLEHQEEQLEFLNYNEDNLLEKMAATKRLLFVSTTEKRDGRSIKNNINEARIVSKLVGTVYDLYIRNGIKFDFEKSIGVIAPYRSQIAMIKNEISILNIPVLNEITVDTVERYQGSQRDVIVYSFSVNEHYQLDFMSNITKDGELVVDRKLNVAITRARKQMFVTGNRDILSKNPVFSSFIKFFDSQDSVIPEEAFS